ncbi:MAG: O-antigen ligase family protein [Bacteroidota bacterium]|nr:O-antigen ligase family protein [Bacteroidota bacterium]
MLIAFLLPFNFGVAIVLVLSLTVFFFLGKLKTGLANFIHNKWAYLFLAFFLIHAICYFFSHNKAEAGTAIEIKLGFIAFPLLIFTQQYSRIDIRKVLRSFAIGTIVCSLFNIVRGVFYFITENEIKYFFYSEFSFFMHPSYYAMYAVFSIVILSLFGFNYFKKSAFNVAIVVVASILLGVCIFMSSSKMGMLSLFVSLPVILFYVLVKQKKFLLLGAILFTIASGLFFVLRSEFAPVQRLKNAFNFASSSEIIDKTTGESNAVRVLIWSEASTLIKQHLLLGVTPGDANDELYKAYEKEGMTGALEKHLNAHNQFLQTAIGTGLVGTLLLFLLTFGILITGFIRKEMVMILFGLIIILNFLVESMLQTQAGTLFFVFFAPLLLVNYQNVNKRYLKS